MSIRDDMASVYGDDLMFLTEPEYDAAIMGVATRCSMPDVVVYDTNKIIEIIMQRDGCTYDDAVEWVDFNMVGAYMGASTPMFLTRWWGKGA